MVTGWDLQDKVDSENRHKEARSLVDQVFAFRQDLESFGIPERFLHSLEDLENYMEAHWPKES